MQLAYVYVVRNTVNSFVYVGSTTSELDNRFRDHCYASRRGIDTPFYDAIRSIGEDNFTIQLLEECDDSVRFERELYWVEEFNSLDKGYNTELPCQPIVVYDLEGSFIGEYSTLGMAVAELNLEIGGITANLRGVQHRIGRYTVFYRDTFTDEELEERLNNIRSSTQYRRGDPFNAYKEGILIGTYTSKTECAKRLGLTSSKVGACLRGQYKRHKGYTFEYI